MADEAVKPINQFKETAKQIPRREAAPTQQFIEIKEIKDGAVFLKNGHLLKIIAIDGINFELKSESEKTLLIGGFQNFLNALDFSTQIFVHTRKINVEEYVKSLLDFENKETEQLMR